MMRSVENVLAEITQRKIEGYKEWIFEDDNFTANKKRAFEICAGLDGGIALTTVGAPNQLMKTFVVNYTERDAERYSSASNH